MLWVERLERPRLLLAVAVVLQWLTTLAVALRADVDIRASGWSSVVVLGPVACVCVYRIGHRLAGVALGAWMLLVWVATPWLALPLTLASYDVTMRDDALPLALGLTGEPGYAAGVLLLGAYALLAAPGLSGAAVAGLATGVAVLLVPETLVFLVPVAVALVFAWRPRELGAFLVAAAPALVLAAAWRQPDFGDLSLEVLKASFAGLREYFWSQRLLQWLPLAGAIAVGRRSVPLALIVGGWVGTWVAVAATRAGTGFEAGEFFRALLPALPAYVVLAAALPLLVPTLAARLGSRARPVEA